MTGALARVAIAAIRGYQRWISPLHAPTCRFRPTCSEYAILALERFGPWRGGLMAIGRLLRCHPLHAGGYDPVPQALAAAGRGEGG